MVSRQDARDVEDALKAAATLVASLLTERIGYEAELQRLKRIVSRQEAVIETYRGIATANKPLYNADRPDYKPARPGGVAHVRPKDDIVRMNHAAAAVCREYAREPIKYEDFYRSWRR